MVCLRQPSGSGVRRLQVRWAARAWRPRLVVRTAGEAVASARSMFAPPWVALWKTTGALRIQKSSQILLGRTSEPGGAPSAGKPNQGRAADADPNKLREVEVVDPESGKTHVEYRDGRGRD